MIKKFARVAALAVLAGGLNLTVSAPADAQVPSVAGRLCSFASVTDPTVEGGDVHTGQINGGPVVSSTPGATIAMTCTIQVGAANQLHSGADACSATSAATTQVAVVPVTLCSYPAPLGQPVWMCTHVVVNGVSQYWDAATSTWSSSASAACNGAIRQQLIPQPVIDAINLIIDTLIAVEKELDKVICPVLASHPGTYGAIHVDSQGDVYVDFNADSAFTADEKFWDCPPYGA